MKKIRYFMTACLVGSLLFIGCGKEEEQKDVWIYYVDAENESLITEGYDWESSDEIEQISFVIEKMRVPTDPVKCTSAIPSDVEITDWSLDEGKVELSFGETYELMDKPKEILMQAALIESLSQIEGVESIAIRVNGELLKDSDGNVIETLTKEDFLLDTEEAFYKAEKHPQLEEEYVEEVEEMK